MAACFAVCVKKVAGLLLPPTGLIYFAVSFTTLEGAELAQVFSATATT